MQLTCQKLAFRRFYCRYLRHFLFLFVTLMHINTLLPSERTPPNATVCFTVEICIQRFSLVSRLTLLVSLCTAEYPVYLLLWTRFAILSLFYSSSLFLLHNRLMRNPSAMQMLCAFIPKVVTVHTNLPLDF
jgi:hypothetical protein